MPSSQTPRKSWRLKHRRNCATGLLVESSNLASGDDAALWAHRSLNEKNKLNAADAQQVEEAFEARLAVLMAAEPSPARAAQADQPRSKNSKAPKRSQALQGRSTRASLHCPSRDGFVTAITSSLLPLTLV